MLPTHGCFDYILAQITTLTLVVMRVQAGPYGPSDAPAIEDLGGHRG